MFAASDRRIGSPGPHVRGKPASLPALCFKITWLLCLPLLLFLCGPTCTSSSARLLVPRRLPLGPSGPSLLPLGGLPGPSLSATASPPRATLECTASAQVCLSRPGHNGVCQEFLEDPYGLGVLVFTWPPQAPQQSFICIPVLTRPGGFLLALPDGALSQQELAPGTAGDAERVVGPTIFSQWPPWPSRKMARHRWPPDGACGRLFLRGTASLETSRPGDRWGREPGESSPITPACLRRSEVGFRTRRARLCRGLRFTLPRKERKRCQAPPRRERQRRGPRPRGQPMHNCRTRSSCSRRCCQSFRIRSPALPPARQPWRSG